MRIILVYPREFRGVALCSFHQRHRLHVFAFEHEPQRTVVANRQHLIEVVRVVFHVPANVRVLPEAQVEAVVRPAGAEQFHIQPRTFESVLVARFRAEVEQVLLRRERQTAVFGNLGP